ncbi:unnamed protein product [Mytilus coruscus]|uniref:Uncharacterized protein n=1 Tax=Mytilus coruscus TaxID=42192 RepID=A0A6J8BD65_MYTCO|nr:unnamed protein product [Mytilus coruscus]
MIRMVTNALRGVLAVNFIGPPNDRANAKEATVTRNGTTEPVSRSNDRATVKEATVTRNGTSNTEWIIYTICITCCFIITVLCHLFRTYKKQYALGLRIVNEEVILKPLELSSYIDDIYDEVDVNPSTFVTTGSRVTSQASNNETINFVFNGRQSNTIDNIDDEAGYFDLYFAMKEDVNQQQENRALQKESSSTSSSNPNVIGQDNTEYLKPYIPLQEYCQEESHDCEVAVAVHPCIERSSGSDEDAAMNIYSNVYIPLQKDR